MLSCGINARVLVWVVAPTADGAGGEDRGVHMLGYGLTAMLMMAWPLLLVGGAAWFFFGRKKKSPGEGANRLTHGLGVIRERTIAIGDTVLSVNNIGSIAILRGENNYALLIIGAIIALVGLTMLGSEATMGLLAIVIGGAMIAINLMNKPDSGLSIGTCDGRFHIIVSTDADFLGDLLDFIRRKVDTGDIKLQGRFDIGARHFNSGGGGIVVGDGGVASGAGGDIRSSDS